MSEIGYWYGENADPRQDTTGIFWASYQGVRPDDASATRSGFFTINKNNGVATNYSPFVYYQDSGSVWWNKPSD